MNIINKILLQLYNYVLFLFFNQKREIVIQKKYINIKTFVLQVMAITNLLLVSIIKNI